MPLDPSLFMQGAQLRALNDARTQSIIGGFFDKLAATREKQAELKKAHETDYEGAYMRTLKAQQEGSAVDPQTMAMAGAYEQKLSAQMGTDQFGNFYPKYSPQLNRGGASGIMDALGTAPSTAAYQSPYAPPIDASQGTGGAMPPIPKGQGRFVNDLGGDLVMPPIGDNYSDVAQAMPEDRIAARGIEIPEGTPEELANSPFAKREVFKGNLEMQKDSAKKALAIEAEKNKPMGVEQATAGLYADRMIEADGIIRDKFITDEQLNLKNRMVGDIPLAGNYLVTKKYQDAAQAERNFINAVLRKESGAVISPSEFENAKKQYFPQPGDNENVIKQKALNRQTAINGISRAAGASYKPQVTPMQQPATQSDGWSIKVKGQ